ncbi:sugar ABC transporter permease [Paenibacillus thiaminolyticus]|uniref:Sugar ABC transporter permease n=1 Tax=Paenibacillus thiaminolyticus TaxID=49283 RepID=A0A3A3GN36_PANTH|nr:ABC transporter permease subunit [Paenibacillus thiaminolyticus]RJG25275.1 sugar ABC transporter permease [Paenibacillus thiaminolyticus]
MKQIARHKTSAPKKELSNTSLARKSKTAATLDYMKKNADLYLFLLPVLIYFAVFHYYPLYGVQIAFKDFSPTEGILGSRWVGFDHFVRFFNSSYAWDIIKNTLLISLYALAVGFPAPLILALLLNQIPNKKFKSIVQTITYAPNFISFVVIVGMLLIFLSPSTGIINTIIVMFGGDPINFMGKSQLFSTIYVLSDVWQSAGWGAIIYLAALSGISPELHEAAMIDGANKFKRVWHIDLPGIMPTVVILLILGLGGVMSLGFEKIYLMQNDLNITSSEIISTYVYKVGLQGGDFSFSTAVGLFNNVVNFVLLIIVNGVARRVSDNSLW